MSSYLFSPNWCLLSGMLKGNDTFCGHETSFVVFHLCCFASLEWPKTGQKARHSSRYAQTASNLSHPWLFRLPNLFSLPFVRAWWIETNTMQYFFTHFSMLMCELRLMKFFAFLRYLFGPFAKWNFWHFLIVMYRIMWNNEGNFFSALAGAGWLAEFFPGPQEHMFRRNVTHL